MNSFFRKRLTYTDEMKNQDKLWETESENFEVMERLHKEIVEEAKRKGFKGVTETIVYKDREVVTEIFKTTEELEEERLTGNGLQIASCGYCKPLIEHLEEMINQRRK